MARTNERLISTFNALLNMCRNKQIGDDLPSEAALSDLLEVSRTTTRQVLRMLDDKNLIDWNGRRKTLKRVPTDTDFLEEPPKLNSAEALEFMFMDWLLRSDVPPNITLNVAQLSKKFSVAPHTLKEFLFALSRFGLVEKRSQGGWMLNGFTREFAEDLSDFRAVLELHAVRQLVAEPPESGIWERLDILEREHETLLEEMDERYQDFSRLDEIFHQTINSVVSNRFADEFQRAFSVVFNYHYQWNKSDERARNEGAARAHIRYIKALKSRDLDLALSAAKDHLSNAKKSLLRSMYVNTVDPSRRQPKNATRGLKIGADNSG